MNPRARGVLGTVAILIATTSVHSARATLISATDVNPDPNIFEAYLTAVEQDLTIDGATVHAMVYKDDPPGTVSAGATIPGPQFRLKVGDLVIVHFKNSLPSLSASIHWHGIELDNDSDGTAVTEDAVLPGQSYTYRFKTFRPGLFWYHPHMMPGNTTFAGMYGPIIIENDIEPTLEANGTLPTDAYTYTLALSDIEFDASGNVGILFPNLGGSQPPSPCPAAGSLNTINDLVALCHLDAIGDPGGCRAACSIPPGNTVLVNGEKPNAIAQTPMLTVPAGKRIRLRLLNESIARHFNLSLVYPPGNPNGDKTLYRIGGQGGLLDNVQLNGGTKGSWVTGYGVGEVAIGSGDRADVLIFPTGSEGDVVQLIGKAMPAPFRLSGTTIQVNTGTVTTTVPNLPATYPIAYFRISGTAADTPPAAGDPILAGTAEDIENVKDDAGVTSLVDPAPFCGSSSETIDLTNSQPTNGYTKTSPAIDRFAAMLDANMGNGEFRTAPLPRPPTARYAHVGDLLELSVKNSTANAVHPFHLHGFSIQPLRYVSNGIGQPTLYAWDFDEFLDTIDVYPGQALVFRVRLDDRPKSCDLSPTSPPDPGPILASCSDASSGGALGRWLFHCHIFHHAALGMMGELTVLPELFHDACFANASAGLTGLSSGSAAWGDYDGDGDLDLLVNGFDATSTAVTSLYNNGGSPNWTLTSVEDGLPNVVNGSAAWGDYDRDGDLDLLMTGAAYVGPGYDFISRVYRNSGGANPTFFAGPELEGVSNGSCGEWGDYDNDGDLDILLTGQSTASAVSKLYRNNGGLSPTFTEIVGALPVGVVASGATWGDYDNDGDFDILITGLGGGFPNNKNARLYRNSGGPNPTFAEAAVGLVGASFSSAAFGDYDNDGDLDILMTGVTNGGLSTTVYRNSGGPDYTFADISAGIIGVRDGSAAWGDFDNDGYLDIAISGYDGSAGVSMVYRNQGGANPTFADATVGLAGSQLPSMAWADYDNDGDLDLLLAGRSDSGASSAQTFLYRNARVGLANTPPTAPSGLHPRLVSGTTVEFNWDPASDAQTLASGLSYNLRIGTTPGESQISSAMADAANGYRRIPALGNANERLNSIVTLPAVATYYWSVQAVDGAWAGSPFAAEQAVDLTVLDAGGDGGIPAQFTLHGGIPNPFTHETAMAYDLPRAERVRLEVFDLNGRRVRTLVSQFVPAGRHQAVWDGTDERGRRVAAGIYLNRLRAGEYEATRRTVLMP